MVLLTETMAIEIATRGKGDLVRAPSFGQSFGH